MSLRKLQFLHWLALSIIICSLILTSALFSLNFNTPWQHFSDQSQSFLQGKFDVKPYPFDQHDYLLKDGKYYWPQGPFPSLLLLPFQAIFGPIFNQSVMQTILIASLIILLYSLSILKHFSARDSIFLTAAFLIASPIIGLIIDPKSWYFAQVTAVFLLTALILELETKKRWFILGLLEGALIATRPTAGLIFFPLLFLLTTQKNNLNKKLINFTLFLTPIIISLLFLMWLNLERFGNPFDNGYYNNDVGGFIGPLRDMGLFSVIHIPTNFYYYFLISVEPFYPDIHLKFPYIKYSVWGLSFLLVAPFFLYSLKSLRNMTTYVKLLWLTIIATLLLELSYYAPGWYQFGPRYTADFLPILFLLVLYSIENHKLNLTKKIIVSLSCIFNLYLITTAIIYNLPH